jgi:hypothetical protein
LPKIDWLSQQALEIPSSARILMPVWKFTRVKFDLVFGRFRRTLAAAKKPARSAPIEFFFGLSQRKS